MKPARLNGTDTRNEPAFSNTLGDVQLNRFHCNTIEELHLKTFKYTTMQPVRPNINKCLRGKCSFLQVSTYYNDTC
jgi:hypothetical protein